MELSFSVSAKFKEWILKLSFSLDHSKNDREIDE